MPEESWSGPRRKKWQKVRIPLRRNCEKPLNGCMEREWKPPYDPLSRSSRRAWPADARWCFHSAFSSVSSCARRFPERCTGELTDIGRDAGATARAIWPGSAAANALLAMDQIFCKGRFRLFIRLRHSCINTVLAARAEYVAA